MDWSQYICHNDEMDELYSTFERDACDNYEVYHAPIEEIKNESVGKLFDQEIDTIHSKDEEENKLQFIKTEYIELTNQTTEIIDLLDKAINGFATVKKQNQSASHITSTLHDECEGYVNDQKALQKILEDLRVPLSYFLDAIDINNTIGISSSGSIISDIDAEYEPGTLQYKELILRVVDCLYYLKQHPSYLDTDQYIHKYIIILTRLFILLRKKFEGIMNDCYQDIQRKLEDPSLKLLSTVSPHSLYYQTSAYHNILLLQSLYIFRNMPSNYDIPVFKCDEIYIEYRQKLILSMLTKEYNTIFMNGFDITSLRECFILTFEVISEEINMFYLFFERYVYVKGDDTHIISVNANQYLIKNHVNNDTNTIEDDFAIEKSSNSSFAKDNIEFKSIHIHNDVNSPHLDQLIEAITVGLYEYIRPFVLQLTNIQDISSYINYIKNEILQGEILQRGSQLLPCMPILLHLQGDIQERLIYRTYIYIDQNIKHYSYKDDDIDYPNCLIHYYDNKQKAQIDKSIPVESIVMYKIWYPSLEITLNTLSYIYTAVESSILVELFYDCISNCLLSLHTAAEAIEDKHSIIDSFLFLIKMLLILREQVSPFELSYTSTNTKQSGSNSVDSLYPVTNFSPEHELDVDIDSERDQQGGIFGFIKRRFYNSSNTTNSTDPLKLIEDDLKTTSNSFIDNICNTVSSETISILKDYETYSLNITATMLNETLLNPTVGPPISESFSLPEEHYKHAVLQFSEGIKNFLPSLLYKIALYIDSPLTQAILFRPIKKILLSHCQHLKEVIQTIQPEGKDDYIPVCNNIMNQLLSMDATKYTPSQSVELFNKNINNNDNNNNNNNIPIHSTSNESIPNDTANILTTNTNNNDMSITTNDNNDTMSAAINVSSVLSTDESILTTTSELNKSQENNKTTSEQIEPSSSVPADIETNKNILTSVPSVTTTTTSLEPATILIQSSLKPDDTDIHMDSNDNNETSTQNSNNSEIMKDSNTSLSITINTKDTIESITNNRSETPALVITETTVEPVTITPTKDSSTTTSIA